MKYEHVFRENEALTNAIRACALRGRLHTIVNANLDVVWSVEPDEKVDDDDLTFPVIVHMRGGTIATEGIAILLAGESVR